MKSDIATDLETGRGIDPHQKWKNWPGRTAGLEVPGAPRADAGLSFLQAALGFVLGCILVIAVLGLLEFRRVALAATATANSFQLRISVLENNVDTLKSWNDSFVYELGELQKHYDQGMALAKQAEKNRLAKNGAK